MLGHEEGGGGTDSSTKILLKIAEALGCSTAAFSEPEANGLNQTAELLRLWFVIDQERDRKTALSFVRMLAEDVARRP